MSHRYDSLFLVGLDYFEINFCEEAKAALGMPDCGSNGSYIELSSTAYDIQPG